MSGACGGFSRAPLREISVELAPRHAVLHVARLRRLARLGEKSALFAAADAFVRPQPFEHKFGGGDKQSGIVLWVRAESGGVIEKAGHFAQLGEMLGGFAGGREFQFTAGLE